MKIEIEFDNCIGVKLIIDGRELHVVSKSGKTTLEGLKSLENDTTMGGMVAIELFPKIHDIEQACACVKDPEATTWGKLTEEDAELFYDRFF